MKILKKPKPYHLLRVQRTKALIIKAIMIGLVIGFAFIAYSYQTGISTDLWIAYLVTGIPIAIGVVIAILILFLFILRFATKRKIEKLRKGRNAKIGLGFLFVGFILQAYAGL